MRIKISFIVVFLSMTLLLTGCNQSADDLLKIGKDVFQELMKDSSSEQSATETEAYESDSIGVGEVVTKASGETEEGSGSKQAVNQEQENVENRTEVGDYVTFKGGEYTPFHRYLEEIGYNLYSLPNGFPFDVPYHWVLVDGKFGQNNHFFEGDFCYNLPYNETDLPMVFSQYTGADVKREGGDSQFFEKTKFTIEGYYDEMTGSLNYYLDKNDITCVQMAIDDFDYAGEYVEDPATMIGPEDPHYEEIIQNQAEENELVQLANNHVLNENRQRRLVDNFDERLNQLRSVNITENDGAKSLRQEVKNRNMKLRHVTSGFARILPYEWYAIELNEAENWSGQFCTDLTLEQSLEAHLDMLENFNADISEFTFGEGQDAELAKLSYAYNDAYGTGSWQGHTVFKDTSENGMRCVQVDLYFSTDILP